MSAENSPHPRPFDARSGDEASHPLLEDESETPSQSQPTTGKGDAVTLRQAVGAHWTRWKSMYLVALFALALQIPGDFTMAPHMRVVELAVCRHYYDTRGHTRFSGAQDIPYELCTVDAVQRDIANLKAVTGTLQTLPGLILGVPYGMLADSIGRKKVLSLSIAGIIMESMWAWMTLAAKPIFPFWMIYLYPLWQIIGGGAVVLINMLLAIISDVAPSEVRTRAFLFLNSLSLASRTVGPPASALLMKQIGPYTAYLLGIVLFSFSLPLLLILPETGKTKSASTENEDFSDDADGITERQESSGWHVTAKFRALKEHVRQDIFPLLKTPLILCGMFGQFVIVFAVSLEGQMMQYMHVRHHWSFEKATTLMSFSALTHLIILLTVIPITHAYLVRKLDDPEKANVAVVKGSIVFHIVGVFIIGISPAPAGVFVGIFLAMLGSGIGASLLSFMTSIIHKDEVGFLYTLLTFIGTIGGLTGTPSLQLALSKGIEIGGGWIGLPFYIATSMYALGALVLWGLRVPTIRLHDAEI